MFRDCRRLLNAVVTAAGIGLLGWSLAAPQAIAGDLNIEPVAQESSEWCWAAATQMIFSFYNVPNLSPIGNYQCAVVGAQGGMCMANCTMCLGGGGTVPRIAMVQRAYLAVAQASLGYFNPDIQIRVGGVLSPDQIIKSIDDDAPILAGVSPVGMAYPPGWGVSDHAVVIEGYDGDAENLTLTVNDPFPPNAVLWSRAGAQMTEPGQYNISYAAFVQLFKYRNSITFDPNLD